MKESGGEIEDRNDGLIFAVLSRSSSMASREYAAAASKSPRASARSPREAMSLASKPSLTCSGNRLLKESRCRS